MHGSLRVRCGSGGGLQIADDGPLSNYTLEVLRLNATESRALRALPVSLGRSRSSRIVHTYEVVRRSNLCEHTTVNEVLSPTDVLSAGFTRSLAICFDGVQSIALAPGAQSIASASVTRRGTPQVPRTHAMREPLERT